MPKLSNIALWQQFQGIFLQIKDKFGVEQVWAGMEVSHKARGHGTIMMEFGERGVC